MVRSVLQLYTGTVMIVFGAVNETSQWNISWMIFCYNLDLCDRTVSKS